MPFMVIYKRSDGTSGFEQADAIDEAAMFVERLRNKDGIEDDIRIYRMEEISFAFRPYYKVELGLPEKQPAAAPPPEVTGTDRPAADPPSPTAGDRPGPDAGPAVVDVAHAAAGPSEADGDAGANGRRGLFGR